MATDLRQLNVRIPEELLIRLRDRAEQERTTLTEMVTQVLEDYLAFAAEVDGVS